MTRTISATLTSAIAKTSTHPRYLVSLAFSSGTVYAATAAANITWNGTTWVASGLEVSDVSPQSVRLEFPNGTADPWLSLILNDGQRGVVCEVYDWHEDTTASPTTDAVKVFSGILDEADIDDRRIRVSVIAAQEKKQFPPTDIDQPTFTYIPASGTVITWGNDKITVN